MPESPHKLRVNIRGSEFEAEGDKDTIMEQYRLFLEAQALARDVVYERNGDTSEISSIPGGASALESVSATATNGGTSVDQDLLNRVFSRERNVVSLRVLPESKVRDADALLLLLYGYSKLKGERDVYGTQLMKAAQQSGLNIDRIDRTISVYRGLFIRGGARRGTRYALNNQGEAKARTILQELFR